MNDNILDFSLAIIVIILIFTVAFYLQRKRLKANYVFWRKDKIRCRYFLDYKGRRQGEEIFYFKNGKVNKKRFWENDLLNGESQVFYTTGELYIQCFYKDSGLDGTCTIYTKDQRVIKSEVYEVGVLKETICELSLPNSNNKNSQRSRFKPLIHNDSLEEFKASKSAYQNVKECEDTKDEENVRPVIVSGLKKIGRVLTGIEALKDRKSAKSIKDACNELNDKALCITESARISVNENINEFGKYRLESLRNSTGKFLGVLRDLNQESRLKEYEILNRIDIDCHTINRMEDVDMAASRALKNTATVGALGAAAAMGTPALVTSAVGAFATASTGTAISTLSGVAATNATLAWLGGGSLAVGGGGVAAGTTVLACVTATATAGVGLIAAGLIATTYYAKKLTEVKEYQKLIESSVEDMEKLWMILEEIHKRTGELTNVTRELEHRLVNELEFLLPLSVDFDTNDIYYNIIFQRVALLAKGMSDLAQTPLLDDEGVASAVSQKIIQDTYTILNKELINHG